jgi:hypothetical protein
MLLPLNLLKQTSPLRRLDVLSMRWLPSYQGNVAFCGVGRT